MKQIDKSSVQLIINEFSNKDIYIHLETTNGAYASHKNKAVLNAGVFFRNALVNYEQGKISGDGPFRVGLRLNNGWVYAEGLTHYELDSENRLLLAGHNEDGKLAVALQLSNEPFSL